MRVRLGKKRDTLSGKYISAAQRIGRLDMQRCTDTEWRIEGKICQLCDNGELLYLAVPVDSSMVERYLKILRNSNRIDDFATFAQNRLDRDGQDYHVTVVSPPEYANLPQSAQDDLVDTPISLILSDISHVQCGEAQDWYISVQSPKIDYLRSRYGLPSKDLHVTLGFIGEPIYDMRKISGNPGLPGPKRNFWQNLYSIGYTS